MASIQNLIYLLINQIKKVMYALACGEWRDDIGKNMEKMRLKTEKIIAQ